MVCGNEKREEAAPFVLWESGRTDAVDSEVKQTQFRRFIPHALFLVFLSCTLGVWWHWRTVELQRIRGEFEEYTHRIRSAIHSQFDLYALYLQGASNLFQASVEVTQEEWREYYEKTRANTLVDRLVSFNYIRFLRADELSDHIGEMRDRGLPAYTVWPAGDREAYAVLVYVEPWNEENQSLRGYDTFSEPIRRDAMEKARDRGDAQITGKVDLLQVKEEIQGWGLVLFAPVYAPMMPLRTPAERQDAIRGYVSGAFLFREFINQILPVAGVDIAFEIYDGSPHDPANRMYASSESSTVSEGEAPLITEQKTIDLNGRQWTILFHSTPVFLAGAGKLGTGWVLVVGLVISFLAYFLVFSLETTRRRALVLAYEMTTALRQSEEKYRIMTESLPIGIAIISLQKKDIVACNEQYKTWFPAVATHAQPVCQIHPCDSMAKDPCATCYLHAILETGSPQKVEETVETAQGRRTFSLLGIPIRDEGGRIVAIHETIEDITERRLAEKRLMDSREQLHAVTNWANDAIIMMDHEGLVSFWNPTAERLFGYTKEEALGRDLHGLIAHSSCHEAFFDAFPEFVETGRGEAIGHTLEVKGVTREGEEIPLEISLSAILLNGRWNAVGIIRDIRDRKQAEQDRIARDAAEAASQAKSQFVANMSHEIRTPMNAILGFAQVLKQDLALTPRQAEFVQIIIQSGNHLLNLINDILDLSKIESGQAMLSPTTFSLYTLLGDLETIFRTRTDEKNLQFLMERSELSSALICADQGKLRQVFVNLIGNAVKFTEKGGVAVRVRLEPHGEGEGSALRLVAEVEDTGQGIPEEDLEKIFNAFYQAAVGLKAGGTGLGLAISRTFIEMMGGTLRVRSTVGRGSRFLFDVVVGLPDPLFAEQQAVVPRHIQGIAAGLGPYRVLLVDDVPANLVLLREMLGPIGFELKEACNGLEALEMFESWEPHAILMDMRMPIMDGYEASRIIKTSPRGALTYVIALTASAFEDYKEKVMETGVDLYMRKPFQTDELYDALAQGLGLHYTYTDDYEELQGEENWITSESISYVPENWVQTLKEAVNEGDIAHVMELIHFLELEKPKMAKELQKLAEQFDYETLLERLRKLDESYG